MNFSSYEMKLELNHSNSIWTEVEIVDIINDNSEFLIKYKNTNRY
jgi:hypothetical protein